MEDDGPWGTDAFRDSRLPAAVRDGLRERCAAARVRPLLVRRHHRAARRDDGPRRVFAAYVDPVTPWLETGELLTEHLLDLDVEALGAGRPLGLEPVVEPVLCVCTHGRHDACCAERGRPVAAALADSHPGPSWEVSHVGGDRFAANLLVLPHGLYYGRVTPEAAPGLAEATLRGEVIPDLLRGRSSSPFPAQVAEVELRRRLGETRLAAVRLVSCRTDGATSVVVHEVAGERHTSVVHRAGDDPARLTCRAVRDNRPPRWTVEP